MGGAWKGYKAESIMGVDGEVRVAYIGSCFGGSGLEAGNY